LNKLSKNFHRTHSLRLSEAVVTTLFTAVLFHTLILNTPAFAAVPLSELLSVTDLKLSRFPNTCRTDSP